MLSLGTVFNGHSLFWTICTYSLFPSKIEIQLAHANHAQSDIDTAQFFDSD